MIGELVAGRIRPGAYLVLLDGLLPVYRALEDGLRRHADAPALAPVARPELFRATALAQDRAVLAERLGVGEGRPLAEGARYAARIEELADRYPECLLAHAYVRHLGDLSGGQILRRRLARSPSIGPAAVRFYEFPEITDLARAGAEYRAALDRAGALLRRPEVVLDEACEAFRLSIGLAEAVQEAGRGGPG